MKIRLLHVVAQANEGGCEQRLDEPETACTVLLQLREAMGVAKQAAEAERVLGGQARRVDHGCEVRDRAAEGRFHAGSRRLELGVGDEAVERVVLPHGRDEGACQIDAHLPVHPPATAVLRRVRECAIRDLGELARPRVEHQLTGRACHLVERLHTFREIVEVLPVTIPLEPLVERLVGSALRQRLADAQATTRGVSVSRSAGQPADPTGAVVVGAMATEDVMHMTDQLERQLRKARIPRLAGESQEIADGERIGPQVTLLRPLGGEARTLGEPRHQLDRVFGVRFHDSTFCWPLTGLPPPTLEQGARQPGTESGRKGQGTGPGTLPNAAEVDETQARPAGPLASRRR